MPTGTRFSRGSAQFAALLLAWPLLALPARGLENGGIYQRQLAGGGIELSNLADGDGFELLVAAPIAEAALAVLPAYETTPLLATLTRRVAQFRDMVAAAARRHGLDPKLLHALIAVESGYNPQAVSPKGAVGLMQLMPATARRYGIQNPRDPQQNLAAGARYLSDLLHLFGHDLKLALAAYNAGEGAVMKHGRRIPPYAETEAYVPKVMGLYRRFGEMPI